MAMIPKEKRKKFDAKSRQLMFVGYGDNQKGYRLLDTKTNEIIISRDVTIIENSKIVSNNEINNNFSNSSGDDDIEVPATSQNGSDETIKVTSILDGVQYGQNNTEIEQVSTQSSVGHGSDNVQTSDDVTARDTSDNSIDSPDDDSFYEPSEVAYDFDTDLEIRRSTRQAKKPDRYQAGGANFAFVVYESTAINNEPITVKQAMNSSDGCLWKAAMDDEFQSLVSNQTWELVHLPPGMKCISNKWVFKLKTNDAEKIVRHKARLVAKGCSQREGIDYLETYSPVVRFSSIRMLMAIAVKYQLRIEQMDVVTAFLHGEVKETIYMKQPENYDDGTGKVCKLLKSLYGLKQASRNWNVKLNGVLVKAGFTRCKSDPCIYVRRINDSMIIVAVYVDDLLIFHNNNAWKDQLKSTLTKNFKMKDLGTASNILGIHVDYDFKRGIIQLDQSKYIEAILRRFNMFDSNPVKLPKDPNQRLTNEMSPITENEIQKMENIPYQEAVGSMLYLQQCTRPDISFSIAIVSQFNQNPGNVHWMAVKRLLRYLRGTIGVKLVFTKNGKHSNLCCYSDSDWGSSFCDYKSCSGFVTIWQGAAISWRSKKQTVVALSTAEAEYMALAAACQETLWLKQLREEVLGKSIEPIELFCDNKAAKDMCDNGNFSTKTKHMSIKFHFLRDLVEKQTIKISKINTERMIADSLTKAVQMQKHNFCAKEMGLIFE